MKAYRRMHIKIREYLISACHIPTTLVSLCTERIISWSQFLRAYLLTT
jgi:hypothetical protein